MFCSRCNNHLTTCTCPDLSERLARLGSTGSHVASRWCIACNHHYALCACAQPIWKMKVEGRFMDLPNG